MAIRIIDNKKIDLTEDEWKLYNEICASYDRPNFEGKGLFKNLFETNNDGVIIFIRPPRSQFVSMEVFMFVMSLMLHQHLRKNEEKIDNFIKKFTAENQQK